MEFTAMWSMSAWRAGEDVSPLCAAIRVLERRVEANELAARFRLAEAGSNGSVLPERGHCSFSGASQSRTRIPASTEQSSRNTGPKAVDRVHFSGSK